MEEKIFFIHILGTKKNIVKKWPRPRELRWTQHWKRNIFFELFRSREASKLCMSWEYCAPSLLLHVASCIHLVPTPVCKTKRVTSPVSDLSLSLMEFSFVHTRAKWDFFLPVVCRNKSPEKILTRSEPWGWAICELLKISLAFLKKKKKYETNDWTQQESQNHLEAIIAVIFLPLRDWGSPCKCDEHPRIKRQFLVQSVLIRGSLVKSNLIPKQDHLPLSRDPL